MKITKRQLRRIIREEKQRLQEMMEPMGGAQPACMQELMQCILKCKAEGITFQQICDAANDMFSGPSEMNR